MSLRLPILLVDDEAAIRTIIKTILTRRGYPVIEAPSGDPAWSTFLQHPAGIALLPTDVMMPGLSGLDLAELVRGQPWDVPILFMSGYCEQFASRFRGFPRSDKPFTGERLLACIAPLVQTQAEPIPARGLTA
jgi:DNA-binding response OmpR family regulator